MFYKLLFLSSIFIALSRANINDVDFKVLPLNFVYKFRYVFSDLKDDVSSNLENGYVNVDIKL